MGHYIAKYVKGCDLCNQMKTFPVVLAGKLMPNHIPYCWWQIISVDLITELPQSHGYEPICESWLESLDTFISRMAWATDEAQAALVKAANDMAQSTMFTNMKPQNTMLATKCGLAQRTSDNSPNKKTQPSGSASIPSNKLSPITHTSSSYLCLSAKSTPSSPSHNYVPMTMTLSSNIRNATHCCHLQSSMTVSKNMRLKRLSTVRYSAGRLNTWYVGKAMALKRMNGDPPKTYEVLSG